jgi:uncharacterized protein
VITTFTLSEINVYPVKSLRGIAMKSATVLSKGLKHDRRYMLCDSEGVALTQREHPIMALFKTALHGDGIEISFKGDSVRIPHAASEGREVAAQVWEQPVSAIEIDPSMSQWFSERIGVDSRLVFFPEKNARPVDEKYRLNDEHVSLADAFPILIIGQKSLDDINEKLHEPVPMNRFRPNLVFTGGEAFAEDEWHLFSIGQSKFAAVKPCSRCILTTIDQDTANKSPEPLKTLSKFRLRNNKVLFGQNVLVLSPGTTITVGDRITVENMKGEAVSTNPI